MNTEHTEVVVVVVVVVVPILNGHAMQLHVHVCMIYCMI